MRHTSIRAGVAGRPSPAATATLSPRSMGLPGEIAFLEAAHPGAVDAGQLAAAAYHGRRERVCAARTLIASGAITAPMYYRALARHLRIPFIEGWPLLAAPCDPVIALRRNRTRLAAGQGADWLVAPTGGEIKLLLAAYKRPGLELPRIAIAAPDHFCSVVRQATRVAIVQAASETLPDVAPRLSAKNAVDASIGLVAALCILCCIVGLAVSVPGVVILLGAIFLASMVCRLLVCAEGLREPAQAAGWIADDAAPPYSVLVPLHREVAMVPGLVAALARLDYPRAKLEVLFLVEQNDARTREALLACGLPPGFRVIVVPNGEPRTKPRALNIGLMIARGELVTVYDAEDRPEPDQLRAAASRFAQAPDDVACLQARLAVSNGGQGVLPRLFAIEYATLFDVFNVGVGRLGLPMALGGTSNHFRTSVLRRVGGWDAYNVTEDADLGLRLSRFGYAIVSLPSTTWEEALDRVPPWLQQRRRWTKGWMQTLVVLARDHRAARDLGAWKAFLVAMMLTHLVTGPLLTPAVLAILAVQLCHGLPGPRGTFEVVEAALVTSVFALGIASTLWCGALGIRARAIAGGWAALPLMLPYQLLISLAAWCGLWDLIRAPYHWHKTEHGVRPRASRSSP